VVVCVVVYIVCVGFVVGAVNCVVVWGVRFVLMKVGPAMLSQSTNAPSPSPTHTPTHTYTLTHPHIHTQYTHT